MLGFQIVERSLHILFYYKSYLQYGTSSVGRGEARGARAPPIEGVGPPYRKKKGKNQMKSKEKQGKIKKIRVKLRENKNKLKENKVFCALF